MYKKFKKPNDLDKRLSTSKGYDAYNNFIDRCEEAGKVNKDLLMRIIEDNKNTEFGREHGFSEIKSVEDFKKKVPLSSYDNYVEDINRMINGESNILTSYPISYYAVTSGSMDNPKNIPVSEETIGIYYDEIGTISQAIYDHSIREIYNRPPNTGKQFNTSIINIDKIANGVRKGPISSAIYTEMKSLIQRIIPWPIEVMYSAGKKMDYRYLRAFYALKSRDITNLVSPFITALIDNLYYIQMNWESLCDDIEQGKLDKTIDLEEELRQKFEAELEPDPERANELRKIFKKGFDEPFIPKIWPKLDYVSTTFGGTFARYLDKIKNYVGEEIPIYSNSYSSSEAILAPALEMNKPIYTFYPTSAFLNLFL